MGTINYVTRLSEKGINVCISCPSVIQHKFDDTPTPRTTAGRDRRGLGTRTTITIDERKQEQDL